MTIAASIACPWQGSGIEGDPYRPALDGLPVLSWSDATGTPAANLVPSPNALVIDLTCADQDALDQIAAAPGVTVLTSEEVVPDAVQ